MDVLAKWREEVWPFCEDGWIVGLRDQPQKAQLDWYEEIIMNEGRLYNALSKEDACSVLGVWRRFRWLVEQLRLETQDEGGLS